MTDHDKILKVVYSAIDELNKQLPAGITIDKSPDAPLYGQAGKLESLDFVTLIMEVEEKIRGEFGIDLTIADENLLSRQKSPFATVQALTDYLSELPALSGDSA
jgi:acyl carrier protein